MNGPKIIKKYANRKLYDTNESKYVTLKEIVESVTQGEEVVVIDNVSKEDITGTTLLSAIVESEENLAGQVVTLRAILKAGGLTKYVESIKHSDKIIV
jgi:polyhydroxyalkanoate synthesis repressor PhaR